MFLRSLSLSNLRSTLFKISRNTTDHCHPKTSIIEDCNVNKCCDGVSKRHIFDVKIRSSSTQIVNGVVASFTFLPTSNGTN
ncbi:hypothetical protein T4D_6251 [Trichinella pseudospiralis]|uniref:Uncharacterized protein n=1 Tax=Trichinella pseudospiralis TaxID=6337 RepID=A0A0V1FYR3_TRIPS|nr:hypothetical protein T4D_6251 [Trichinella pseudospiralis]